MATRIKDQAHMKRVVAQYESPRKKAVAAEIARRKKTVPQATTTPQQFKKGMDGRSFITKGKSGKRLPNRPLPSFKPK
jgi:hypothetical protein